MKKQKKPIDMEGHLKGSQRYLFSAVKPLIGGLHLPSNNDAGWKIS